MYGVNYGPCVVDQLEVVSVGWWDALDGSTLNLVQRFCSTSPDGLLVPLHHGHSDGHYGEKRVDSVHII